MVTPPYFWVFCWQKKTNLYSQTFGGGQESYEEVALGDSLRLLPDCTEVALCSRMLFVAEQACFNRSSLLQAALQYVLLYILVYVGEMKAGKEVEDFPLTFVLEQA